MKRLSGLKNRFAPEDREAKAGLLALLRDEPILDPDVLLRYHETLLFVRAYPDDERVFQLVRDECERFVRRVRHLGKVAPAALAALEDTGIAGTGIHYPHGYPMAVWLVERFRKSVEIDWDELEATDRIDALLPQFAEWLENDGLDLADISTQDWIALRMGAASTSCLEWLLRNLRSRVRREPMRAALYDSLDLPLIWRLEDEAASRTLQGVGRGVPHYHRDGLLRKARGFSREIAKPLTSIRPAPPDEAHRLIGLIRCALATRHRSLYPVEFANPQDVIVADLERGYRMILFGTAPGMRLPVESDYGVLILKNGYVFGYGVGAILFDQVEIAVNIFDTWRGGEAKYVFTQFVRTFRGHFGVTRFKIERYQVGYENEEGIQSGAFWFYYNLGFVPARENVRQLAWSEKAKITKDRSYRTPASVLKKLAESDLYLSLDRAPASACEDFPLADLSLGVTQMIAKVYRGNQKSAREACARAAARALACTGWKKWPEQERTWFQRLSLLVVRIPDLERWPQKEKAALRRIMRAKGKPQEAGYVRLMAGNRKLQRALKALAAR